MKSVKLEPTKNFVSQDVENTYPSFCRTEMLKEVFWSINFESSDKGLLGNI